MKNVKKICLLAVILIVTAFIIEKNKIKIVSDEETRGIYVSYIEFTNHLSNKSRNDIKLEIENIIKTIKEYNFNLVILQVRPFSDSIYNSKIFPTSWTVAKVEGEKLEIDILDYFIKIAHRNDIKVHAWINPYRISNNTDTSKISDENPAYKWLNTNNVKVIIDKGIYYNPASNEVIELIVDGIEEIITNYDVDGIHLDDYFYPDDTIDIEDYEKYKNEMSLSDYRLNNTNRLIKTIYDKIKEIDSDILFGISPEGNIENNYNRNYADVKTWLQEEGYIDYIMPQIYYGFFNETKPFIETVNEWQELIKNDVTLIPALALYKTGTIDEYAKGGKEEWIKNSNTITNQIKIIRNIEKIAGYSLFRYDYLLKTDNTNLMLEQENLRKL